MPVMQCVLLSSLCLLALANANPVMQRPLKPEDKSRNTTRALSMQVPINHFNGSDNRTYANRYWANTEFHEPGGPIFYFDPGEQGVFDRWVGNMFSDAHLVMRLAEKFNGTAVVWEHRFYGESFSLPLNLSSTDGERENALQYLNTEQALEDVVFFATHFNPSDLKASRDSVAAPKSPWIYIGGSYPGQRAAMVRKRNPDVFFASWSSSAPVQDSVTFPEYYLHIGRDLPPVCRVVIQRIVKYVDDILANGTSTAQCRLRWTVAQHLLSERSLRERLVYTFYAPHSVVALQVREIIAFDWQSAGMHGAMNATCTSLFTHSNSSIATALDAALDAIKLTTDHRQRDQNPAYPMDSKVWQYQVCTEYPYLRIAAAATHEYNILSIYLTEESEWANCVREFPWLSRTSGPDPSVPLSYTSWETTNVSHIMWTTGLKDPWHGLAMVPVRSLVSGAPVGRTVTREVPGCGIGDDGEVVFGLVFEEGRHCGDFVKGSVEGGQAVRLFEEALVVWLPCFYEGRGLGVV